MNAAEGDAFNTQRLSYWLNSFLFVLVCAAVEEEPREKAGLRRKGCRGGEEAAVFQGQWCDAAWFISKASFIITNSHFTFPFCPEDDGLGGAPAKKSAPSLPPLHYRQRRRQQLRRGVHHWSADAHSPARASHANPQRPGELPGLWLRLRPLLMGCGVETGASVLELHGGLGCLSAECLSAFNYTVNECWRLEAVGLRLLCSRDRGPRK